MAGNCPNCGAPIDGIECGYCGTTFVDFTCIDIDRPFFIKLKAPGSEYVARACVDGVSMECRVGEAPVIEARFYVIEWVG